METPKFTQADLAGLIAEAVAWLQQQRNKYHAVSDPLDEPLKIKLRPFFATEILDGLRMKDLSATALTVSAAGGYPVLIHLLEDCERRDALLTYGVPRSPYRCNPWS